MKNLLLFLLLLIIAGLLYFLYECREDSTRHSKESSSCKHIPVDMKQVVFWRKPGVSIADFKANIDGWFHYGAANQIRYCEDCDSSLVVVSGDDVVAFLSGQTASGSPPKNGGGPSGDDAFSYYSMDFPMEFKDSISVDSTRSNSTNGEVRTPDKNITGNAGTIQSIIDIHKPAPHTNDTVTVAVFDTGVDPFIISNQLYTNDLASCLSGNANNGWNFPGHNEHWQDDFLSRHGTVVSKLIVDQEYHLPDTYIKILPVKVHDSAGVSHLSDILCALQYAKNRNAKIINASFGFYAPSIMGKDTASTGALLFSNFLKEYFKNNAIIMIAAAGNLDDKNENSVYFTPTLSARRNLDSVSFYPASFASSIPNIFAVTTLSEALKRMSPHQNFSANVVDLGVNADLVKMDAFVFINPYRKSHTVEGSSFATPIATGKMAAHFNLIKNYVKQAMTINDKDHLLDKLQSAGLLHIASDTTFKDKIRKKRMMNK